MFDFVFSSLSLYFKVFSEYWIYPVLALSLFATIPCILRYFLKR